MNNLKYVMFAIVGIAVVYTLMNGQRSGGGAAHADLDQALNVAAGSLNTFENSAGVTEENAMDKFATNYARDLNSSQPPLIPGTIGVEAQPDGSFKAFSDTNNNAIKDADEKEVFDLEVDKENNRLLASDETAVRESGFSGSGLLMGMLIGNMLSRQRVSGANPAARKATPRSAYRSARSRAGSGSHSRGK